jgi:phage terminase large subunit-like protein
MNAEIEALQLAEELDRRASRNVLIDYKPYLKQSLFHDAGAWHRERCLMAANQVGKTLCASREVAMHMTGRYPDWWKGKVFPKENRWWFGSETSDLTRDAAQKYLLGEPKDREQWGTGAIPHECVGRITMKPNTPDGIQSVLVRHTNGKWSTGQFKSYDQGRERWQGETLDGVWYDEEPPQDIYTEGLTRTNSTKGITILTFTPLKGMSTGVMDFMNHAQKAA